MPLSSPQSARWGRHPYLVTVLIFSAIVTTTVVALPKLSTAQSGGYSSTSSWYQPRMTAFCQSLQSLCQQEQSIDRQLRDLASRNNIGDTPTHVAACAWQQRYCPTGTAGGSCPIDGQVCGTNGETLPNVCEAIRRGIQIVSRGACSDTVGSCPDTGSCRFLGCPSGSSCSGYPDYRCRPASCGVGFPPQTPPAPTTTSCDCGSTYQPVCGYDGRTYQNECQAMCNNVYVFWPNACGANGKPVQDAPLLNDLYGSASS